MWITNGVKCCYNKLKKEVIRLQRVLDKPMTRLQLLAATESSSLEQSINYSKYCCRSGEFTI